MELRKTVLVGHSAEQMFDLIEAAEHYPDFLPWCAGATIVERDESVVVADIDVDVRGVRFGFRTRNPKRRPNWMAIQMERGPFRNFQGEWRLTPLTAKGCRIEFELRYGFDNSVVGTLASSVFDHIADTLVDAYVARADWLDAGGGASAGVPTLEAGSDIVAPPGPPPGSDSAPSPTTPDVARTPAPDAAAGASEPSSRSNPT
jgi:ribosome-associated toxin RatA of RatAB toxin-antitoxin module